LYGRNSTKRRELEIDERDVWTVTIDDREHLIERACLDYLKVALAREQVANAGAENAEWVSNENARASHALFRSRFGCFSFTYGFA
jgi:hypothetical protein